ncbi:MAG: hypothetical protein KY466_08650 [Gemmatimonadetes bacterium]|nr:hypothetical protein [Gemmatimonadota bacterium]
MFAFRGTSLPIRESAPPYGTPDEPDRFPADEVLADLERATGADAAVRITRILARYAALRHWVLRVGNAPAAVTDHARRAARAYLSATLDASMECGLMRAEAGWAEGALLLRMLDARPDRAGAVLAAAGAEAAAAGDDRGASALGRAAVEATLLRLRSRRPPPDA